MKKIIIGSMLAFSLLVMSGVAHAATLGVSKGITQKIKTNMKVEVGVISSITDKIIVIDSTNKKLGTKSIDGSNLKNFADLKVGDRIIATGTLSGDTLIAKSARLFNKSSSDSSKHVGPVRGVVKAVDANSITITETVHDRVNKTTTTQDATFTVGPNTKVMVHGVKDAKLGTDIIAGDNVIISANPKDSTIMMVSKFTPKNNNNTNAPKTQ